MESADSYRAPFIAASQLEAAIGALKLAGAAVSSTPTTYIARGGGTEARLISDLRRQLEDDLGKCNEECRRLEQDPDLKVVGTKHQPAEGEVI